jgi:phytoene dehydrogenase-like protein
LRRRFRGLRSAPRERYDAVVIGAGIGGLVAANLLARGGLSVLVVEQHYMVGGYCSIFRRDGFTFDASTHFYPLVGNPETEPGRLLADLGVAVRWLQMDPVDVFHLPDGARFEVPTDFATYQARLHAAFPDAVQGLGEFFAAAREANTAGLLGYFRGQRSARLERWENWTVRDALDRFIPDSRLRLLLTADCPHWGSPPCRTSFVFDSMLRLAYFLGNYYPEGSSQAFTDDLARCLEERGGEILTSTAALRILTAAGRAEGVEIETTRGALSGRRTVRCDQVIANGDLRHTLGDLLGGAPEATAALRATAGMRPSFPCFLTHLGLMGVPRDEIEAVQGYYWNEWNPDDVGRGALACKVFSPTLYDPDLAPPGGQIVILQKVVEVDCEPAADPARRKAEVERFVLEQFERILPGSGRAIVSRSSASDDTAERFTRNRGGAMLGWEMSPDQLGGKRPDVASPFANLHFVGHWTRPGGGVAPVLVSAMRAAEAILCGRRSTLADRGRPGPARAALPPVPASTTP